MKMEPGIYPLNRADVERALCHTVDFALTLFCGFGVSGAFLCSVNLLISDAGGLFGSDRMGGRKAQRFVCCEFINDYDVENKIKNRP
jgi:CO dehydrogenase/acetyl-CoA synthase gamma subunit (corrinoid Fe-S protein)